MGRRTADARETILLAELFHLPIVIRLSYPASHVELVALLQVDLAQTVTQPLGRLDVEVHPGELLEQKLRKPEHRVVVGNPVVDPLLADELVRMQVALFQELEDGSPSLGVPIREVLVTVRRARLFKLFILFLVLLLERLDDFLDRFPVGLPVGMVSRDLGQGHPPHQRRVREDDAVVPETEHLLVDLRELRLARVRLKRSSWGC